MIFAVLAASPVIWLLAASTSLLFIFAKDLSGSLPVWQWPAAWPIAAHWFYAHPHAVTIKSLMALAGPVLIATLLTGLLVQMEFSRVGGWRGIRQGKLGIGRIVRGTSNNHGQADWMPDDEVRGTVPVGS